MKAKIARTVEILLGIYMVVGALPKVWDINRFSVQMSAYQVIKDPQWLPPAALTTIFAEMALGMAFVLAVRLKGLTLAAFEAMLVVFTGLIIYAWVFHGLEDCGCFPLVKMTPPVSIAKNVVMAVIGLYLWWAFRPAASPPCAAEMPEPSVASCVGGAKGLWVRCLLVGAIGMASVVYAAAHLEKVQRVTGTSEVGAEAAEAAVDFRQFVFDTDQGAFDLGKGDYLVPILSMTCEECMGKVPDLNNLSTQPGMPPMVALCYEDKPGDLDNFKNMTNPAFPLHPLGDHPLLYYTLRGEDPFRCSLVHDGGIVRNWDGHVPDCEEVLSLLPRK